MQVKSADAGTASSSHLEFIIEIASLSGHTRKFVSVCLWNITAVQGLSFVA